MTNRRRLEHYDADLELLHRTRTVLDAALRRMGDARLGYPATSMGGSGSGGNASPVERAVIAGNGQPATDPGRQAIATYDRLSHELHHVAEAMHHLVSRWAPHQPNQRALTATENANVAECAHHRATIGTHEPAHREHTDAGGCLPESMALCRWCHDFTRRTGRLPSRNELDRRQRGLQVRLPA